MRKKNQAQKKAAKEGRSKGISFKTVPATEAEIGALAAIIENKKYWQRGSMKKNFVDTYNRVPAEVDALIKGGDSVVRVGEDFKKAAKNALPKRNESPIQTNEIRIPIKGVRIEGKILVIEIDK